MIRRIFFITILCFAAFPALRADDVRFTASAPKQVISGQQFQVVFTLQNGSVSDFHAPDFPGCSVLYGPAVSQSSQVSFINGKTSRTSEYSYTYTLRAEKEGTHTFAAATVKSGGKQYSSNTLSVRILPPDKNSAPASGGNTVPQGVREPSSADEVDLFARLILSKTSAYEQEPILATLKIYLRGADYGGIEGVEMPSFDGFVSQEIELGDRQIELDNYNGYNYQTIVLRQLLLYPQRTGEIKISEGKFDLSLLVVRPIQGPFGGLLRGTQEITRTIETRPATVKVKPLPAPRPATYMNAVGTGLKLTSTLSHETVKANEAVTLSLKLSGTGNLKYMKNPEVKFPVDFDVYDPKIATDLQNTTSGVKGTRTIEYTAIPRSAGEFVVPPVEFTYFDLTTGKYKTLATQEYRLTVEKGESTGSGTVLANFSDKEAIKHLNQDIHFIKLGDLRQKKDNTFFYGSWGYWLWYIVPVLLLGAFVLFNYRRAKANADVARMKTRKANKVATRRLKVAGKYLQGHDSEHFYDETLKALWGYLSDKLLLPLSELTRENVAAELKKYGADDDLTDRTIRIVDTCEFARYAPSQSDEAMDTLYAETLEVIGKMENVKRKNA